MKKLFQPTGADKLSLAIGIGLGVLLGFPLGVIGAGYFAKMMVAGAQAAGNTPPMLAAVLLMLGGGLLGAIFGMLVIGILFRFYGRLVTNIWLATKVSPGNAENERLKEP